MPPNPFLSLPFSPKSVYPVLQKLNLCALLKGLRSALADHMDPSFLMGLIPLYFYLNI